MEPTPDRPPPETVARPSWAWNERLSSVAAHPASWLTLTLAVAVLDFLVGPHVSIALIYLVPVTLAAWYGRRPSAVAIAVGLPVFRLAYFVFGIWDPPGTLAHVAINAAVRAGLLSVGVLLIQRARRTVELEQEVAVLRGMLPICMYCKRIQDAEGSWQPVEQFLAARSEAAFTHRVCPYCTDTHRGVFLGSTR